MAQVRTRFHLLDVKIRGEPLEDVIKDWWAANSQRDPLEIAAHVTQLAAPHFQGGGQWIASIIIDAPMSVNAQPKLLTSALGEQQDFCCIDYQDQMKILILSYVF